MMMSDKFGRKLIILSLYMWVSTALAVEKPTSLQKTCVTQDCHAKYGKKAYVHGPLSLGDCKSCHKPVDPGKHTFQLARQGKDLCEFCHLEQTAKKNVHEPVKAGKCVQCHDPHSSDNRFLISEKTVAGLCRNCHQTGKNLKYLHGPMALGDCTVCHETHSSDYKNLLTADPGQLCFSCHTTTRDELSKFEFVHKPATNDCVGCHNGHGANNPMMLKAQAPELCYPCHENIKKIAETAKFKHAVVSEPDGCVHCHTPHASTIRFELKDTPAALCLSCHDKPVGISKDVVLPAFTAEIKDKKFPHGPVAQKDCKGCHVSHGSEHFRLLAKEYPPQFYAPYSKENYELCFSCHPESLVSTKETTTLTDFRNGNVNLHFVHVDKPQKGRTCRSCHATHASNLPKHIRESVPFGKWNLPIQFEKTETGGGCKPGCHLPRVYDRQAPVDYKKTGLVVSGTHTEDSSKK